MKIRVSSFALAPLLCLGFTGTAFAAVPSEFNITWLPVGYPVSYNRVFNYVTVVYSGSYTLINLETGEIVDEYEFDYMRPFSDGLAWVREGDLLDGKSGYIDKTGKIVLPLEYDLTRYIGDGFYGVQKGESYGI